MVVFSTANTPFISKISIPITGVTSYVFNYSELYNLGYRSFLSILQPQTTPDVLCFLYNPPSNRTVNTGNPSGYTTNANNTSFTVTVSTLNAAVTYNVGIMVLS
jgi:hypothetical protein